MAKENSPSIDASLPKALWTASMSQTPCCVHPHVTEGNLAGRNDSRKIKSMIKPGPIRSKVLRAVSGFLGFVGLASVAFITYDMFAAFAVWKLLLTIMGLPGAAMFLFCAFYRAQGGPGGTATLGVTWPRPTKPPSLSPAAAEAIPREPDWLECRGTPFSGELSVSVRVGFMPRIHVTNL